MSNSKVTLSFDINVSDLTFNKGKNGITYINIPPYIVGKVSGMKAKAHIMRRNITIIRDEAADNKKVNNNNNNNSEADTADNARLDNLEASINKLAEMMAALAPKAKAKAKA